MSRLADWAVISGPILSIMGAIGRTLAKKLNQIGEHLERQDAAKEAMSNRISRLEGTVYKALNGAAEHGS